MEDFRESSKMAKFGVSQYDHSQFEQKWNVGDKCYAGYCKCFTYVTKTFANLTTYSRKPENYNGTIIFEIDIMKNSSPINLNLCQTWLFQNVLVFHFEGEHHAALPQKPVVKEPDHSGARLDSFGAFLADF